MLARQLGLRATTSHPSVRRTVLAVLSRQLSHGKKRVILVDAAMRYRSAFLIAIFA